MLPSTFQAKAEHNEVVARFLNDDIYAQCRRHPDRLVAMATLPLQNIELAVKVGGARRLLAWLRLKKYRFRR